MPRWSVAPSSPLVGLLARFLLERQDQQDKSDHDLFEMCAITKHVFWSLLHDKDSRIPFYHQKRGEVNNNMDIHLVIAGISPQFCAFTVQIRRRCINQHCKEREDVREKEWNIANEVIEIPFARGRNPEGTPLTEIIENFFSVYEEPDVFCRCPYSHHAVKETYHTARPRPRPRPLLRVPSRILRNVSDDATQMDHSTTTASRAG